MTSQADKAASSPGESSSSSSSTPGRSKHSSGGSRQRSSSASSDRSSGHHHHRRSSSSNRHSSNRHHHHQKTGHQIDPGSNLVHRSTSTSAKTRPMHDDTDAGRVIPVIQPALAIDYLGNSWSNEDDIAASWKFMTKQKNDMINGLRLENASWRNWAKQRHQLKTVSPKSLNWLKDSDTTWLYGPLYKASIDEFDLERFGTQSIASPLPSITSSDGSTIPTTSTASSSNTSINISSTTFIPGTSLLSTGVPQSSPGSSLPPSPSPASSSSSLTITKPNTGTPPFLKPVLKHKTASELFKADTLFHVQSDLKLSRRIEPYSKSKESAVFKEHRQPKLRFNDSVEQCISVDTDAISEEDEEEDEEGEDEDELGESQLQQEQQQPARPESDGGGLELRRFPSTSFRHASNRRGGSEGGGGRPYTTDEDDDGIMMRISARKPNRPPRSIVRINPTKLKDESLCGMPEDELSHSQSQRQQQVPSAMDFEDDNGAIQMPTYGSQVVPAHIDDDMEDEEEDEEEEEEEEGLFEQPLYLGNPYTGTQLSYAPPPGQQQQQQQQHQQQQQLLLLQQQQQQMALDGTSLEDLLQHQEAAMAEVSYTQPLPPSDRSSVYASFNNNSSTHLPSEPTVNPQPELDSSLIAGTRSPAMDSATSLLSTSSGSSSDAGSMRLYVDAAAESDDEIAPPVATAMAMSDPTATSATAPPPEQQQQEEQQQQQQQQQQLQQEQPPSTLEESAKETTIVQSESNSAPTASASSSSSTLLKSSSPPPPATAAEGLLAINKMALEREAAAAAAAGGPGFGRRAVDLVTNVKDLVSWASSLVRNSSTF
ncbi:hypothetical protein BGZ83_010704 [Gryganskiella cystojenkinii]|nr:hypothetical protein BGZ83_010704 [Gryganskiella cystojenkinii]